MRPTAILFSFLVLAGCHKKTAPEKNVTPVKAAAVDLYQPASGTRYSATILPGKQVSLSFRVTGFVTSIHSVLGRQVEPGDIVPGGTVLARLRAQDYDHSAAQAQSQLEAAQETQRSAAAQLAQSRASQAKAEADFHRAKILFEQQSMTRPEFDAARAQLDVALAQVEAAKAQLEGTAAQIRHAEASRATARLAQNDTALTAPFTAALMQRNIEVGMLAGPSLVACTLADVATVKAGFGVPDTVVVGMKPGRSLPVTAEALPGQEFRGTVTSVAPVADSETRLFQVEVTIPNRGMLLKPGMIASIVLQGVPDVPAVPVIPVAAVMRDRSDPSGFSVMVVEGRVARLRRVALGPAFGEVLAVKAGLRPGEMVIRAGATMVSDGEPVEVIQ